MRKCRINFSVYSASIFISTRVSMCSNLNIGCNISVHFQLRLAYRNFDANDVQRVERDKRGKLWNLFPKDNDKRNLLADATV